MREDISDIYLTPPLERMPSVVWPHRLGVQWPKHSAHLHRWRTVPSVVRPHRVRIFFLLWGKSVTLQNRFSSSAAQMYPKWVYILHTSWLSRFPFIQWICYIPLQPVTKALLNRLLYCSNVFVFHEFCSLLQEISRIQHWQMNSWSRRPL